MSSIALGFTTKGKDTSSDLLPRRQSTRTRPLSTKACEALEIELLSPVSQSNVFYVQYSITPKVKVFTNMTMQCYLVANTSLIQELLGLPEPSFSLVATIV